MEQLPESDIPFDERLIRLREAIGVGCEPAELMADAEVLISVV